MVSRQTVARSSTEPDQIWGTIAKVVEVAQDQLEMDLAFLGQLTDRYEIVHVVAGDASSFAMEEGMAIPRCESYCQAMIDGRIGNVVRDAAREPGVAALPITGRGGIGRYVGVPVHLPDGSLYGALCGLGHSADPSLGSRDANSLGFLASMVESELEPHHHASVRNQVLMTRLRPLLGGDGLVMEYQPIVALSDGATVGFEALARFSAQPLRPPDAWFADAAEVGFGLSLEMTAIHAALGVLEQVPEPAYLTINLSAETACSELLGRALSSLDHSRVVLEITEHAAVRDYETLNECLSALRQVGVRLAVDDAGAGMASLHHILELSPNFIKMDISLTRGIDASPARAALATALVTFGEATGAAIVAEGIETPTELDALRRLGVGYGQGNLLGQPGPLDEVNRAPWPYR